MRALAYFLEEAFTSLWRSRLINALSIGTIAVSLFVLGAFLTVASNLNEVVAHWAQKVQVTFYLEDGLEDRIRESLENRLKDDPGVDEPRPRDAGRRPSSASGASSATFGRSPTTWARIPSPRRSR